MINVAVIGFGLSGSTFHAPVLSAIPELRLHSVVTSKIGPVQETFPQAKVRATFQEVLADPEVDLVVITVPNELHAPFAEQALNAGKHVVVEKPFVIESKVGLELAELARRKEKVLSVYHNRRWDNGFLSLRKAIKEDLIGEIYSYEAHFDRYRPEIKKDRWREQPVPGSGILFDLGSHLIDQALTIFGAPETVYCDLLTQRKDALVDDYFHIILGYGKRRVSLGAGCLVPIPGAVLEVQGQKGTFLKHGLDPQEDCLRSGARPGQPLWGLDSDMAKFWTNKNGTFMPQEIETVAGEYQEFYRQVALAILGKAANPVSAEEACLVISVIKTCKESSRLGRVLPFAN